MESPRRPPVPQPPPSRPQEFNNKNPSPLNSPRITAVGNGCCAGGGHHHQIPIARSDHPTTNNNNNSNNPYPTTFVQADTTNFKQVVQMLTGSSESSTPTAATKPKSSSSPPPSSSSSDPSPQSPNNQTHNNKSFVIPPIKTNTPKKQGFKLYERRTNSFKNSLIINTLLPSFATAHHHHHHHSNNNGNSNGNGNNSCGFSPRNSNNNFEILSPSMLDFPKLGLNSPVTPLNIEDPYHKSSPSLGFSSSSSSSSSSSPEEERAIAEKGFYLHPSPISTPRDHEPQLLPLFPVTSPRVSGSSAS